MNLYKILIIRLLPYFLILLCFFNGSSLSEYSYVKNYFRSPVDFNLSLTGSFGELRPNHFHSGIDITTDGIEGKNVYAIADGYVSRIKVSAYGFGKAIYINHPNGYTSVYAHLQKFNSAIEQYIKQIQYSKESFEVELFPKNHELIITKGQIIAFSGNTGSSAGPHLHFEIRETKSETPLNPLLFGYPVTDNIPPTINKMIVYPLDRNSMVENGIVSKKFSIKKINGQYFIDYPHTIKVHGKIGFGIDTHDLQSNSSAKNGVHSIELLLNDKTIYYHKMERFSFNETRYINCHIDYEEKLRNKNNFQKSFLAPNNLLSIYENSINRGIINFNDNNIHYLKYIIKDFNGNKSILSFKVQSTSSFISSSSAVIGPKYSAIFPFSKKNTFKTTEISIEIPENILYDSLLFEFNKLPSLKDTYTPVFQIHNKYTPVHSYFFISIKADKVPQNFRDKALIVSVENDIKTAIGGSWEYGFVTAKVRSFGNYAVAVDSIRPIITPLNISPNKSMKNEKTIKIRIKDNLSGIKSYKATVDGKWILMEYDAKARVLTYVFDERVSYGRHNFSLTVTDNKNNIANYSATFLR